MLYVNAIIDHASILLDGEKLFVFIQFKTSNSGANEFMGVPSIIGDTTNFLKRFMKFLNIENLEESKDKFVRLIVDEERDKILNIVDIMSDEVIFRIY